MVFSISLAEQNISASETLAKCKETLLECYESSLKCANVFIANKKYGRVTLFGVNVVSLSKVKLCFTLRVRVIFILPKPKHFTWFLKWETSQNGDFSGSFHG